MKRCWVLLPGLMALQAQADVFVLDGGHTQVGFDVRQLGVPWIAARFGRLSGRLVVDRDGADSRIEVTVRTDSIEGLMPFWIERLRSPGWLDTRRYPEMTYRSSHVAFGNDGQAVADGELTLHGVTRPVQLSVRQLNCPTPESAGTECAFSAFARVRRSDFGLPHGLWVAGDGVEISVSGTARNEAGVASR